MLKEFSYGLLLTLIISSSCNRSQKKDQDIVEITKAAPQHQSRNEKEEPKQHLPAIEYARWIQDNLIAEKQIENYRYKVLFEPLEYKILKERKGTLSPEKLTQERDAMGDLKYFILTIGMADNTDFFKNSTDNRSFNDKFQYYAYDMQRDIQLVEGKDSLSCVLYHFERTYGVAPYHTIILGFESHNVDEVEKTIIIHDQLAKTGIVKLKIKSNQLKQIPELKL